MNAEFVLFRKSVSFYGVAVKKNQKNEPIKKKITHSKISTTKTYFNNNK